MQRPKHSLAQGSARQDQHHMVFVAFEQGPTDLQSLIALSLVVGTLGQNRSIEVGRR